MLRRSNRYPRNARCHCGSGKKYKYCCHASAIEQPHMEQRPATYIDSGENPVRYVIADARGTSFFATKDGRILVFPSKADAFAIATSDEFANAEPGEINVAGVGETKWAHIQKTLPFIEPDDVEHAAQLVRERMEYMLKQLSSESSTDSNDAEQDV
jgi:hypothetical protein